MVAARRAHTTLGRAAVAIAFAALATACSGGSSTKSESASDPAAAAAAALETSTTSVPATTAPPTTTVHPPQALPTTSTPGELINQFTLEVGDCFDQSRELQSGLPVVTTTRVGCDIPHEFEVYHRLEFPAASPAIYPGDKVMRDFALESCYRVFDAWVGEKYELSTLDIEVLTPTQDNFEDSVARYRGIHCFVHRSDGSPLVATTRGSGL